MQDSPPVWKDLWQLLWPEEESVLIKIDDNTEVAYNNKQE